MLNKSELVKLAYYEMAYFKGIKKGWDGIWPLVAEFNHLYKVFMFEKDKWYKVIEREIKK